MKIYKITNLINNKVYIGQCFGNIEKRFKRHCRPSSGCLKIKNAIFKYGRENFKIEQIDTAESKKELSKKEIYWINHYNSVEMGYNLTLGGEGGSPSEETKAKISKTKKGTKLSKQTKELFSKQRQGHNNSKAKKVLVEFPDGNLKEFDCLRYASDYTGLSYSCARALAQGINEKSRNGIKIKYLE